MASPTRDNARSLGSPANKPSIDYAPGGAGQGRPFSNGEEHSNSVGARQRASGSAWPVPQSAMR
jgi:hypothetical protein